MTKKHTPKTSDSVEEPLDDQSSAELDQLKQDIETMRVGWQRTQADFENFRRRTTEDHAGRVAVTVAQSLLAVTQVAENLRRSLNSFTAESPSANEITAWRSGVEQVARQLDSALVAAGLEPMNPAVGDAFNPAEHEAVSQLADETVPADHVLQLIERGWRSNGRVLKPATVVVSAGKAAVDSK